MKEKMFVKMFTRKLHPTAADVGMQHGGTDGGFSWNTEELCLQPETLDLVIGSQVISSEPSLSTAGTAAHATRSCFDTQLSQEEVNAREALAARTDDTGRRSTTIDGSGTIALRRPITCSAVGCNRTVPDRTRGGEVAAQHNFSLRFIGAEGRECLRECLD